MEGAQIIIGNQWAIGRLYIYMISLLSLIAAATIVFLIGSICIVIAPVKIKAGIALSLVFIYGCGSSLLAYHALTGAPLEMVIADTTLFGDIPLRIDALSAFFILIINFTLFTGGLYGANYMRTYREQKANLSFHWILFIIFHLSMLAVCVIQNGLAFLVAWEIMSLSSMLLVIFEHYKPETLRAGVNYLIQMHVSVVLLTLGVIGLFTHTGSFDFAAAGQLNPAAVLPIFACFFVGFALKAGLNIGILPLNTWLPQAHPAAPAHISGMMSGVMIKLGIYGILRMILLFPLTENQNYLRIGWALLGVAAASGIYGIMLAIIQHNLKKLLAYSSIENIGIIGMGIGLGLIGLGMDNVMLASAGFLSALLHTLNHALFKSLLFYTAGTVYHATHSLKMESLGGLFKKIPQTASLFLLGALAICGFPPFNGFISEFLLYSGLYQGILHASPVASVLLMLAILSLVLIGGLALLGFTKAFGVVFLGKERQPLSSDNTGETFGNLLPLYVIGVFILSIGLFPSAFVRLLSQPVALFVPQFSFTAFTSGSTLLGTLQHVSWSVTGLIAMSGGVLLIRHFITSPRLQSVSPTWGCGYVGDAAKMQYTANSFVRMYRKLAESVLLVQRTKVEIKEVFPQKIMHYETHIGDILETNLIDQPLVWTKRLFASFHFLQNGKIQNYILYGIVFMLTVALLTWLKLL
ncbi:MAG TPA: hypothetical protein DHU63_06470 [Candidatus Marinimicrobia bacterium]|nr:MAG: hypothetical protein AUJ47_11150 [Candidatus Marinimicrobia bacterium CG1_02_48_14]PIZ61940.1 MAG: hypothetical protein COY19_11770 [Candidatus Marinimicrobia bacterium CG_4_10_14_0_2_um_filter_48_9]PJA51641.1 MAG: hypothetical protein CO167_12975 [Candidatus Marinimicrobia bacterium CG_4_9_14_3_um_filter_48_9]HCW76166.1 hypothetical protein [Candidatus Neomarinimicrobiota bacterium]